MCPRKAWYTLLLTLMPPLSAPPPKTMHQKAEPMCKLPLTQLDSHESSLLADETRTDLALHTTLYLLVCAIATFRVFERKTHPMCPQPADWARLEGVAQLMVIGETDRTCSGQVKFSASFWFSAINEHPQLIGVHDVPKEISSVGLTVLLELKVV